MISRALASAAPPGWHTGLTGLPLLASGKPAASKGTSVMAEAMIGALGALAILALVFASFLALLPLPGQLVAARRAGPGPADPGRGTARPAAPAAAPGRDPVPAAVR